MNELQNFSFFIFYFNIVLVVVEFLLKNDAPVNLIGVHSPSKIIRGHMPPPLKFTPNASFTMCVVVVAVYLYGAAATSDGRKTVPQIRAGEYEGLEEKVSGLVRS